jgi:hypothetical protein
MNRYIAILIATGDAHTSILIKISTGSGILTRQFDIISHSIPLYIPIRSFYFKKELITYSKIYYRRLEARYHVRSLNRTKKGFTSFTIKLTPRNHLSTSLQMPGRAITNEITSLYILTSSIRNTSKPGSSSASHAFWAQKREKIKPISSLPCSVHSILIRRG